MQCVHRCNSPRRRADAACNSSSRGPFRAPIGSLESSRGRAARLRGPYLRTPLSSRVVISYPCFYSRPPSLFVEYPGPNARYVGSRCSIATTIRHIMTLQSDNPLSFCHRSSELPKNQGRASRRTRFLSWCSSTGADGTSPYSYEWPSFPWFSPRHYEHPPRHVRTRRACCDWDSIGGRIGVNASEMSRQAQ